MHVVLPGLAALCVVLAPSAQQAPSAPAPIRIYHDELGLPHVFADTDAGVFRGHGYAQVLDFPVATLANLWSSTGRFAEVAGENVLARDLRMRQWGIDREARALARDPARLDAGTRAWLQAYVDGVNAGRRAWLAHPQWIDALFGANGELWFDPVPEWLHPAFRKKDDPRARLQRLFEGEIGLEHVLALGVALAAGPDFGGAGQGSFTNVWLMRGGERDRTTRLLADVHQPLQESGYRSYPAQLAGPGYDLVGLSSPGFPCIVLGATRRIGFASMTLPKKPRELAAAALPFRIEDRYPLVTSAWNARLEPDAPARFVRGTESVPLVEESVTLGWWSTAEKKLVADREGARTLRWVRDSDTALLPVIDPPPKQTALDLAAQPTIRYEARSFAGQRSLWETWMELGTCARVGAKEQGVERAFARESLATGRGQMVLASDVGRGFAGVWSARVPCVGEKVLAHDGVLDGSDPEQRWDGFHPFAELPHWTGAANGKQPEAWIECNSSPHHVRGGTPAAEFAGSRAIWDGESWKTLRQARARELFERSAADGVLANDELERMALDVQDQWSRVAWPWIRALVADPESPVSVSAQSFVEWAEVFRFEGPDGKPGDVEFLAHPLSQVMPFMVLLRDAYEDGLVAARAPAAALALAFDPELGSTTDEQFLADERFAFNRVKLRQALEQVAQWREKTLAGTGDGLRNVDWFQALATRAKPCDEVIAEPWSAPIWTTQASEWGPGAPRVALRWGEMNVYALTPHRPWFDPKKAAQYDAWLETFFTPCSTRPYENVKDDALLFHRAQPAVVFPIGGTHDSLFQVHRESFRSYAQQALLPRDTGKLALAPIDFGSQALFLAELVPGARPRVRVLPALAGTELLCPLPDLGVAARELFRPTARFARGEWSTLVTDEAELGARVGVRKTELRD